MRYSRDQPQRSSPCGNQLCFQPPARIPITPHRFDRATPNRRHPTLSLRDVLFTPTASSPAKKNAKARATPFSTTEYDADGRLAQVACDGEIVERYLYNAKGQRTAALYPSLSRASEFSYTTPTAG